MNERAGMVWGSAGQGLLDQIHGEGIPVYYTTTNSTTGFKWIDYDQWIRPSEWTINLDYDIYDRKNRFIELSKRITVL